MIFKKPGAPPKVSKEVKEKSLIPKEKWNEYFSGHWYFNGEKQKKHIAMFPVELPKRIIKMFSFADETVLDPFLGSGTTSLAAMLTGRNSVGYEINENFLDIIKKRLGSGNQDLFENENEGTYKKQQISEHNRETEINSLPHIFHYPVLLDKKIDPHK